VGFKNWKVVALPKALQNKDLGKLQILTTQTLCKHQVTNLAMQCTNYRLPINRLFIYLIEIDSYELLPQETRREKRNFPSAARKRGRCFVYRVDTVYLILKNTYFIVTLAFHGIPTSP
jgi:hypothetical protein